MNSGTSEQQNRREYAKSALTRDAILAAAFPIFGARGLHGAGTREIAEAAGVNQPAINYHFGSKEELYRACAEQVVEYYQTAMGALTAEVTCALAESCGRSQAEVLLTRLMEELTEFLLSDSRSHNSVSFVVREMSEQGQAALILHQQIWQPGTELAARLIEATWGIASNSPGEEARLEALMLISNLVAFTNGRPVSMQILGWKSVGRKESRKVKQAMARRVQDIASRSTTKFSGK